MAWSRIGLAAALILSLVSVSPPAAAQDAATEYLLLGEDATGDAQFNGVPMIDTWIDINGLGVATVGTDLVFHLGLQGTTTEAGQYCWMAAFDFGGKEYVGLDCYEGVAYEGDNTLSSASPPSTSRGTNVASSVVFDATGAVITIPLDAIGAKLGDTISDIYGLTYFSRALIAVDTVPDAKRGDAKAAESLGSYVIGGASPATATDVVREQLNGTSFEHSFTEASNATYVLNLTVPWGNASVAVTANATAGSANVTITRGNETLLAFTVGNATGNGTASATSNGTANRTATATAHKVSAAGNWTITVTYAGYVGSLGLNVTEARVAPPPARSNTTSTTSGNATAAAPEETGIPALGPALAGLALVAVAAVRRRKA